MESVKSKVKGRYFRKAVIYFLTFCLISNTWLPAVLALGPGDVIGVTGPTGGAVFPADPVFPDVSWVDPTIVTENGAIIDWSNFNTVGGETVTFEQYDVLGGSLNSMSAVLNRISSGAVPTEFNGALTANGRVFIVNPAGVMFGSTATVNVTQLIASSLNIDNEDFLAGNYLFAGDGIGEVVNEGTINATEGAALIGKMVRNAGTIATGPGGFVVMAAGDRVLLGEPGSKIIVEMDSVTTSEEGIGNVINEGEIIAPGGTVALAAGDIFSAALDVRVESGVGTVEQNGVINADGIDGDGGSVTLTAGDNVILADGSLTTANGGISNAGANGGEVIAYASELFIYDATVDFQAGAQIEVKGGSPLNPAAIDEGATFNGGLAEISGDHLFFDGTVDATATPFNVPDPLDPEATITITPDGGTLHIDPVTLTVANGGIPEGGAAMDTFYEVELESYSDAGVDTILEGDLAITVEHMTDGEITGGTGDIVLRTAYNTGGIEFLPETEGDPITTTIRTTGGGNIFMLAGSGGIKTGNLLTYENGGNPGRIRIFTNNGGNIETGALLVDGGNDVEVSIIASGNLVINGDVITNTNKVPAEYDQSGTAYICLVSETGNVNILGAVEVEAHGKDETVAKIHICANGTITVATGNGRVQAISKTSSEGTSDATIRIHAGSDEPGAISITRNSGTPIRLQSNTSGSAIGPLDFTDAEVEHEETLNGAHLLLQIADAWLGGCIDCPTPPDLPPPAQPPEAPIAVADDYTIGKGDILLIILNADGVLINDDDPDGEPGDLIAIIFGGTATTQGGEVALEENGGFTYTPPEDKLFDDGFGTDVEGDYALFIDTFSYYVEDPDELSSSEATVTVTSKNYIPVANPDFYDVSHNATLDITDSASGTIEGLLPAYADLDADPGDTLSAVLHGDGASALGGSVVLNADGTFTYTPPGGVVGTDKFMYYATDGYNNSEIVDVTIELINALPVSPAAPGLMPIEVGTSGCPALVKWAAAELGADQETIQIWFANSLASGRSIQPCDACTGLKAAATVLQDDDGTHLAALAAVISEFASSDAPPSEEQMASIADAIANDIEGNMQYAAAGEYLDALAAYVGVLTGEMGLSASEAVQLATDNYVGQLADDADAGVVAYVATRLAELGG